MMLLVVGLVIGAILGAALIYMLFQDQLDKLESQDEEIKTLRNAIASQESQREARLREATEALQKDLKKDYDRQLAEALAAAEAKYQGELTQLQGLQAAAPTPEKSQDEAPRVTETIAPEPPQTNMAPVVDPWGEEGEGEAETAAVSEPTAESPVWIPEPAPQTDQVLMADTTPDREVPETIAAPPVKAMDMPATSPTPSAIAQESGDPANLTTAAGKIAFLADLGAILGDQPPRAETLNLIPLLGRLSRDEDGMVRQQAIAILGRIKDPAVITWLEQGRYDGDPAVAQIASAALERYKTYPQTVTKPAPRPPEPVEETP